jgi:hypothetical protein
MWKMCSRKHEFPAWEFWNNTYVTLISLESRGLKFWRVSSRDSDSRKVYEFRHCIENKVLYASECRGEESAVLFDFSYFKSTEAVEEAISRSERLQDLDSREGPQSQKEKSSHRPDKSLWKSIKIYLYIKQTTFYTTADFSTWLFFQSEGGVPGAVN